MVDALKRLIGLSPTLPQLDVALVEEETPSVSVENLGHFPVAMYNAASADLSFFDGDKFYGGFGSTRLYIADYWTLRQRSSQLFTENLYARGIIRRLVTNEINTGLSLEATPGELLGISDDARNDWSDNVENRFEVWAKNPLLCDYKGLSSFGKLQAQCRLEALVGGDVLVVSRISRVTNLPQVELIDGSRVQTPFGGGSPQQGNEIKHGVEVDSRGRHIAFHVLQENGTSIRIPAYGERTGRRTAWLVYGTDKRIDDLRGQPILALILQSLKDIDRYRDAAQRKAVVNSILAMYIKKSSDKPGTRPVSGGAVRRDSVAVTDGGGTARSFNIARQIPGVVMEELQEGEEPVGFNAAGVDLNFPGFEAAVVGGMAWALEIPPEIITLAFASNYSASRGAVNEFKLYLDKSRNDRAEEFCEPFYQEWLLSEVLTGKIDAPGFLEARRNPMMYDTVAAWISSDWSGAIKPSVDLKKEVDGYKRMEREGWITNDRATRELSGTKWAKNIKRRKKENEMKAAALEPLLKLQSQYPEVDIFGGAMASSTSLEDKITELMEDANG